MPVATFGAILRATAADFAVCFMAASFANLVAGGGADGATLGPPCGIKLPDFVTGARDGTEPPSNEFVFRCEGGGCGNCGDPASGRRPPIKPDNNGLWLEGTTPGVTKGDVPELP